MEEWYNFLICSGKKLYSQNVGLFLFGLLLSGG